MTPFKDSLEGSHMTLSSFRLYDYIVDVVLEFPMHHVVEDSGHSPLIHGTRILKAKWHHGIVEISDRSTKCGLCCVSWCHLNLIVATKTIHKGEHLMTPRLSQ